MEVSELLVNYVDLKVKHTLSIRANCILKTNSLHVNLSGYLVCQVASWFA